MGFKIHTLGEDIKTVKDSTDAMYHLAAKYGAVLYNAAVKQGFIVFNEDHVKVRPFEYTVDDKQDILGICDIYVLTPKKV